MPLVSATSPVSFLDTLENRPFFVTPSLWKKFFPAPVRDEGYINATAGTYDDWTIGAQSKLQLMKKQAVENFLNDQPMRHCENYPEGWWPPAHRVPCDRRGVGRHCYWGNPDLTPGDFPLPDVLPVPPHPPAVIPTRWWPIYDTPVLASQEDFSDMPLHTR